MTTGLVDLTKSGTGPIASAVPYSQQVEEVLALVPVTVMESVKLVRAWFSVPESFPTVGEVR